MEEALAEAHRLAGLSDEQNPVETITSLRNAIYSIESQAETLNRIMFLVRSNRPLHLRPSVNGTFNKYSDTNKPSISILKPPLSELA